MAGSFQRFSRGRGGGNLRGGGVIFRNLSRGFTDLIFVDPGVNVSVTCSVKEVCGIFVESLYMKGQCSMEL